MPYARVVGVPPSDAPMRRIAAETIDSLRDSADEPAKDVSSRRGGMLVVETVYPSRRRSWLSGQHRAEQGRSPRHDGVERATQAIRDLGRGLPGVNDLAVDLVANFDIGQVARKDRRQ